MTSLVVPRPIGWISTWNEEGTPNLAPYSYFNAVSSAPLLVGVSIGTRLEGLKDTLVNIRARGAFCHNVVSTAFLEAMNQTSADVAPGVDEFALAGLTPVASETVDAPYVSGAPAVLECVLRQEVELEGARNTLVIGEVVGIRVDEELPFLEGAYSVDPAYLLPVGRLAAGGYSMPGELRWIPRPTVT